MNSDSDLINRSLDKWYININSIYLDTNFYRDSSSIFTHLVEVIGGLSLLASEKYKKGIEPTNFVSKSFAWWMSLCGNLGIKSVSEMVWLKFPSVCPYCLLKPHDNVQCKAMKRKNSSPDWQKLGAFGTENRSKMPNTLDDWQRMFSEIYPIGTEGYQRTFSHLTEELGELAEAIRVFPLQPSYFLSEASDVFAWLMHLQNLIIDKSQDRDEAIEPLSAQFAEAYPDYCSNCNKKVCSCPPILNETLGRIAKENPIAVGDAYEGSSLISASEAMKLFEIGNFDITIAGEILRTNSSLVQEIYNMVVELRSNEKTEKIIAKSTENKLELILHSISDLTSSQRITQKVVDELVNEIRDLPADQRTTIIDFLGGLSSSLWASNFLKAIDLISL